MKGLEAKIPWENHKLYSQFCLTAYFKFFSSINTMSKKISVTLIKVKLKNNYM